MQNRFFYFDERERETKQENLEREREREIYSNNSSDILQRRPRVPRRKYTPGCSSTASSSTASGGRRSIFWTWRTTRTSNFGTYGSSFSEEPIWTGGEWSGCRCDGVRLRFLKHGGERSSEKSVNVKRNDAAVSCFRHSMNGEEREREKEEWETREWGNSERVWKGSSRFVFVVVRFVSVVRVLI